MKNIMTSGISEMESSATLWLNWNRDDVPKTHLYNMPALVRYHQAYRIVLQHVNS